MNKPNDLEKKYTYYCSFSTPELEQLLKIDFFNLEQNGLSPEEINLILEILSERKENETHNTTFDVDAGWNSFKKNYLPLAKNKEHLFSIPETITNSSIHNKLPILRKNFAATIIIGFIVVGMFSTTTLAQNLFSAVANWTKEIFWFNNNVPVSATEEAAADLESVYRFLETPANLLPTWLPEGFTQTYKEEYETSTEKTVYFFFNNNNSDSYLSISISYLFSDVQNIYEKDSSDVLIYSKGGIDYYIMSNINTKTAIWKNGSFECQIDGTISTSELQQIIDSIPVLSITQE